VFRLISLILLACFLLPGQPGKPTKAEWKDNAAEFLGARNAFQDLQGQISQAHQAYSDQTAQQISNLVKGADEILLSLLKGEEPEVLPNSPGDLHDFLDSAKETLSYMFQTLGSLADLKTNLNEVQLKLDAAQTHFAKLRQREEDWDKLHPRRSPDSSDSSMQGSWKITEGHDTCDDYISWGSTIGQVLVVGPDALNTLVKTSPGTYTRRTRTEYDTNDETWTMKDRNTIEVVTQIEHSALAHFVCQTYMTIRRVIPTAANLDELDDAVNTLCFQELGDRCFDGRPEVWKRFVDMHPEYKTGVKPYLPPGK